MNTASNEGCRDTHRVQACLLAFWPTPVGPIDFRRRKLLNGAAVGTANSQRKSRGQIGKNVFGN